MGPRWNGLDRFLIAEKNGHVIRSCPFCAQRVEDPKGNEVDFILHLGMRSDSHSNNKNWENYIKRINPAF